MRGNQKRWWVVGAGLVAVALAGWLLRDDLPWSTLSLEGLQRSQGALQAWRDAQPVQAALTFFLVYVAVTAVSFPGATVLTLAAGALFGLAWGSLIVSFASSIGATLAFGVARWLAADAVRQRFGDRLAAVHAGIARDGGYYLFSLRLVPVLPFFLINLVMGLTPMRATTFYWVSQLGMLPATLIYVNAGTQLAQLSSLSGIVSPGLLGALVLLGVLPLASRWLSAFLQARKVYAGHTRPRRFDRNLIVIGGGSAGLVTAYIAAALKSRVTLVEKHQLGGDCLNTGCVPSKALIRSARFVALSRRASEFGLRSDAAEVDFPAVMDRVRRVIQAIEPHDSAERYRALGVEVLAGNARIVSPWCVEITQADGGVQQLSTRGIVIAAGAHPVVPPLPGLDQVPMYTSDTLWSLRELPRRLVVLGGGPIGSELTQAFARLGAQVTLVEMSPRLLMREDPEVSAALLSRFEAEGITVRLQHRAVRVDKDAQGQPGLWAESPDQASIRIPFDAILVAVGRQANLQGYGLQELGVRTERTVEVNGYLQTNFPNIYAAGDVAGPFQFTHTAAHQAWYAAVNALFDPFKKFKADYRVIPWATFVDPEVARVGLNELDARQQGVAYEVTKYDLADLDRAIADGEDHGFIKLLTVPGSDRILGVTIVGDHAGDLLAEYVLAMKHGIGLNKMLGTIHTYPTFSEANKFAAGQWKRAHAPQALLAWVGRFHAWRRG